MNKYFDGGHVHQQASENKDITKMTGFVSILADGERNLWSLYENTYTKVLCSPYIHVDLTTLCHGYYDILVALALCVKSIIVWLLCIISSWHQHIILWWCNKELMHLCHPKFKVWFVVCSPLSLHLNELELLSTGSQEVNFSEIWIKI